MDEEFGAEYDGGCRLRSMRYLLRAARESAQDNETLEADQQDIFRALAGVYEMCYNEPVQPDLCRVFVVAVKDFARFLGFRGELNERVRWGKAALSIAELLQDSSIIAELCASTIAWPLLQQGHYNDARYYCLRGLEVALSCNDDRWAGAAARSLSGVARDQMNAREAQHWAEQAMEIGERVDDRGLKRGASMDLAYAALLRRDFGEAERLMRSLLQLYVSEGDKERTANFCAGVAMTILNQRRTREAHELYVRALDLGRELESEVIMGEAEFGLAAVAELERKSELALRLMMRGSDRFAKAGITRPSRAEQFVIFNE